MGGAVRWVDLREGGASRGAWPCGAALWAGPCENHPVGGAARGRSTHTRALCSRITPAGGSFEWAEDFPLLPPPGPPLCFSRFSVSPALETPGPPTRAPDARPAGTAHPHPCMVADCPIHALARRGRQARRCEPGHRGRTGQGAPRDMATLREPLRVAGRLVGPAARQPHLDPWNPGQDPHAVDPRARGGASPGQASLGATWPVLSTHPQYPAQGPGLT